VNDSVVIAAAADDVAVQRNIKFGALTFTKERTSETDDDEYDKDRPPAQVGSPWNVIGFVNTLTTCPGRFTV